MAQLQAAGKVDKKHDDRAVIMIFNLGAPSQQDCFDLKPEAPAEIRGPFKPIATASPDLDISEIFPLHAKQGDKFSMVRSCYHTGGGGARHRASNAPNRAAVSRRDQHAPRRLRVGVSSGTQNRPARPRAPARTDGQHRRRLAPRPGCGLFGQRLRSLPPDGRPFEARLQSARTSCRRRASAKPASTAGESSARSSMAPSRRSSKARTPSFWTAISSPRFA